MTGPGNPAQDTEAAEFRSWTWRDHLCCWRWGTSGAHFPRVLRWIAGSQKREEKEHVTRLPTYLYRGTGYPCAGHISVTEPSFVVRKLLESSIVGNLGLTLPIGSDHIVTIGTLARPQTANANSAGLAESLATSTCSLYLNRGTGNPCAGHTRAWEPPTRVRKPRTSSVEGIFGRTLPTGSKKHAMFFLFFLIFSYKLDNWIRDTMSYPCERIWMMNRLRRRRITLRANLSAFENDDTVLHFN